MDLMDEIPASLIDGFREEARELLVDMEGALMELELYPRDEELIARAFRALHTIKGSGAMFGFGDLESFAHDLEHVFDLLRKGRMTVTKEIIDLTLAGKDRLLALLFSEGDTEDERRRRAAVRSQIARVIGGDAAAPAAAPPVEDEAEVAVLPPKLVDAFKQEARELLVDLEAALMQLEQRPDDAELIARAFRALHTIKGNGGMFGFVELEAFAHELENVFDLLRRGEVTVSRELIDLTLEARDRILRLLGDAGDSSEERALRTHEVEVLHRIAEHRARIEASPDPDPRPGADGAPTIRHRIVFRPERSLLAQGTDPLALFEELRALGSCRIAVQTGEVPSLSDLDPAACHLAWVIDLESACSAQELRDAFIFVGDDSVLGIESVEVTAPAAAPERLPEPEPQSETVPAAAGECGPSDVRPAAEAVTGSLVPRGSDVSTTLRVASIKLDRLVNLVGELVTVQARLSRLAAGRLDPELLMVAEEVERLSGELRDTSLNIRMIPIGPAFAKFRRLIRDLARGIGREVDLETAGEETELDKTVIDRLGDPLLHLLRNSIDHGIENPEDRVRAGKPRRGVVRLAAAYSGANVVIRVSDDGAGIDPEAVRQKAVERGIIAEHDPRSERGIFSLLFLPGFSTSTQVTSISGRGVGLDVVKRAVEALRGAVRVESRRGEGTAFEIRLPLTLAIIEGLEVVVGGEHFILPLTVVKECVELTRREGRPGGRRLADIRGEILPYVRLRDWFAVSGEAPSREQIIVTESDGVRVGFVVDYVVGEQQTVIKSLGHLFRKVRGLAGATILGDGTVALILDIAQLVHLAEREEIARAEHS